MLGRGYNPTNSVYSYYDGRGVTVCDRWRHSFQNFLQDMGPRGKHLTLERINPFGNYEPGNCKWATRKEQANNTRAKYLASGNHGSSDPSGSSGRSNMRIHSSPNAEGAADDTEINCPATGNAAPIDPSQSSRKAASSAK